MGAASAEAVAAKLRRVRRNRQLIVDWAENSGHVKLKVGAMAERLTILNPQCVIFRSMVLYPHA